MLVDSHCHLNFEELYNNIDEYLFSMRNNNVGYALCVATRPDNISKVVGIADKYSNIYATVGVHPDEKINDFILTEEFLYNHVSNSKVIGIGETGLDYYRAVEDEDMTWQHNRFKLHIAVAKRACLPLIIHTRNAIKDTLDILGEYNVKESGAVMHCFTESIDSARKCIDMGFYISISGIVTFKNAMSIKEMARFVPNDRLLIETDAPFLAPMPYRGKLNHPALVKHTAEYLAKLRGVSIDELSEFTTDNFFRLFAKAQRI